MNKISIGMFFGIFLASLIYIPIIYLQMDEKYKLGIANGKSQGLIIAANAIEKEFGKYDGKSKYIRLFYVKTKDVIVTSENGNKTIKVIP